MSLHQYADDTQLYIALSKSDMSMSVDKLQNCLSTVHLWFSQNGLVINPEKSEAVLLSTSQQRSSVSPLTSVNVAGCVVPLTDTVKILGVTIDHHLTFNKHVQNICKLVSWSLTSLFSTNMAISETRHLQVVILPYSSTEAYSIISNDCHGKNCCVRAGQFAS